MTIRARSIILSAFLLFSISSCISVDNRMGSDYIPTNQILYIRTQEFKAPMFTAVADSINMSSPSYLEFGSVNTPVFGNTTTAAVVQFAPYAYQKDYGENPVVQNMYVNIPIGGFAVFDQNDRYIPQNIYVYKLVKDLNHLDIYHNSFSEDYIDPIPVSKPGLVFLGRDTLRIDFTDAFAYELLAADSIERDSTKAFLNKYKGLYFTTERFEGAGTGGRINYLNFKETNIFINYKAGGGDSLLSYYFNIYGTYYNISSHESAHLAGKDPSDKLYYEGLAGVKPRLDITTLTEQIKAWGLAQTPPVDADRILISRAELVMPVEIPTGEDYAAFDNAPATLYPCNLISNDSLTYYSPLEDIYFENAGRTMNRSKWEYTFDITSYLQKILSRNDIGPRDDLWIMPVYLVSTTSGDTYYVDNFTYRNTTLLNGNLADRSPYVRITYAVLLQ
ncbi:MAG: hypothetical protein BWX62_00689 [Bacteroidetes bacterium ADurb.Bin037]|nr:MAG: hypothetical protein BWX62_00689 [Bacteroidetes bacterium ADurb.Bin037]HPW78164.1 DUF4270 family protein [Bacteroidales bacterium]HQB56605.1 DUF4270 family protein [Bacteroidales bacterium]